MHYKILKINMNSSITENPLYPIANPRHIVFFGASNNFSSMGSLLLAATTDLGFEGPIYPVHRKDDLVQDLKAYRHVSELPEIPDLAVIVLPTHIVCETLEQCGKFGIRSAVVVSGGFKEVGGEGIELEKKLAGIAEKYQIRILGPNCLGVSNLYHKINTTPMPVECEPGFIGLVSQSGSFVAQMYAYLDQFNLGFSTAFSVGNQLNVDIIDCMRYLAECPHTKVIALYIESIDRGEEFIQAAREITPHKPIVALYVGGSETGRRAAFSHTGSLSGPDELYEGAFQQSGVIRAHTITELFDYCGLLGSQPKPNGNNIAILTHSGGPGAVAADGCGRLGLNLPTFTAKTCEDLKEYIPHTGNVNNPVDLTFTRNPRDLLISIPEVLLEDEGVDILLIYLFMPEPMALRRMISAGMTKEEAIQLYNQMMDEVGDLFNELRKKINKPIIGFTFRDLGEKLQQVFMDGGMPVFPSPDRAVKSINALVQYYEYRKNLK